MFMMALVRWLAAKNAMTIVMQKNSANTGSKKSMNPCMQDAIADSFVAC